MSYTIWLDIDTGAPTPARVADSINYTSNVFPMWIKALEGTGFDGLDTMDGHLAGECLPALETAIAAMRANPAVYTAMNPPGGWGNADGARQFLGELADMCSAHPKATVRIWH